MDSALMPGLVVILVILSKTMDVSPRIQSHADRLSGELKQGAQSDLDGFVLARFPDDSATIGIGLEDESFVAMLFARDDDDMVGMEMDKGIVICIVSADVLIQYRQQRQVTEDLRSEFQYAVA
jgi:hypothetical protein